MADTYDGDADPASLTIRDAIHRANVTVGTQTIWLPAWNYVLTNERTTQTSDTEVSFGDLDITQSLTIRGVDGLSKVAWRAGTRVDKAFELLGDYNDDGFADGEAGVNSADWIVWRAQEGRVGENLAADGNDDGVVNGLDYDIWEDYFGTTFSRIGVLI